MKRSRIPGATVDAVFAQLTTTYPDLKQHLFTPEGKLRSFVNVYLNDDDIRYLGERKRPPSKTDDTITIIPSIAGGSASRAASSDGGRRNDPDRRELPKLSNEEIARYSRHLILPEVGMEGQQKLKAAKVLCVGTGGLGAPLALYLAAAGVGTLGLVDFDVVDESATCSARSSTRSPPSANSRSTPPSRCSRASTRTSTSSSTTPC